MQDKIKPMVGEEIERFKALVKENMKNDSLSLLELNLRVNSRFKQQYELRMEVIQELINEKRPDFKAKQYLD